jgi:hypothetical protein
MADASAMKAKEPAVKGIGKVLESTGRIIRNETEKAAMKVIPAVQETLPYTGGCLCPRCAAIMALGIASNALSSVHLRKGDKHAAHAHGDEACKDE